MPTDPIELLATAILGAWLFVIAIWDARTLRIPDFLSLPLVVGGFGAALTVSALPFADHLIGAAAGYAAPALLALLYRKLRGREGLGLGDAKLLAAAGAWLAWPALPSVLLVASFTGLGHALMRAALGRGQGVAALPFGPHIAFAFMAVWLLGPFGAPPVWR